MTAKILDGKAVAAKERQRSAARAADFVSKYGRAPGLAVVKVGEDPASAVYVRNKRKACEECGIASFAHDLPATTSRAELLGLIDRLNRDDAVDGILLQLPLPKGLDSTEIMDTIDPAKDVDGFHPTNTGLLAQKRPGLRPCTPWGVMRLLKDYSLDVTGLRAVVVGASNIVGRPMALELLLGRATVTVCHTGTRDLRGEVERADLVVAAVGKPAYIPGIWIRDGAIVIDVGINRLPDGKLAGDVEYAPAAERAAWITPVPGGVGPMTIAMLLSNTVDAALARKGVKVRLRVGQSGRGCKTHPHEKSGPPGRADRRPARRGKRAPQRRHRGRRAARNQAHARRPARGGRERRHRPLHLHHHAHAGSRRGARGGLPVRRRTCCATRAMSSIPASADPPAISCASRCAPICRWTWRALTRNFYTTSSCGVCGKASIEAVTASAGDRRIFSDPASSGMIVRESVLRGLPDTLKKVAGRVRRDRRHARGRAVQRRR